MTVAYHDVNNEGLTFSEWVQAAGLYKPMQGSAYGNADCAGYSTLRSGYRPIREGERRDVISGGYFFKRTSSFSYPYIYTYLLSRLRPPHRLDNA